MSPYQNVANTLPKIDLSITESDRLVRVWNMERVVSRRYCLLDMLGHGTPLVGYVSSSYGCLLAGTAENTLEQFRDLRGSFR
jgi:hypothetical protein